VVHLTEPHGVPNGEPHGLPHCFSLLGQSTEEYFLRRDSLTDFDRCLL
jgi:hypothetical protein